ncbi:MAG: hypothetical protein WAV45_04920 [Propionibacteriaceae bacterium]
MIDRSTFGLKAHVLTLDAVKWGIAELKRFTIHPHFFAYLFLVRSAALGDPDNIEPDWRLYSPYVRVPTTQNVVHASPMFRPISNNVVKDENTYWVKDHHAGSFAPSSIRNQLSFMVEGRGQNAHFRLPPEHGRLALDALLTKRNPPGTPIPAAPVAAYLLRNQSFASSYANPERAVSSSADLVESFRDHFGFHEVRDGEEAFATLFGVTGTQMDQDGLTEAERAVIDFTWFEPIDLDLAWSASQGGMLPDVTIEQPGLEADSRAE